MRVAALPARPTTRPLLASGLTVLVMVGGVTAVSPAVAPAQPFHSVGVTTRTFVDASRPTPRNLDQPELPSRTLETTIWYPATLAGGGAGNVTGGGAPALPVPDAPPDVAGGPYPLLLFAHGYSANPRSYEPFIARLASSGYVVVAPRFPLSSGGGPHEPDAADVVNQPGDLSFLIDELLATGDDDPIAALVDPDAIGVTGHSNGGVTTLGIAAHSCCRDDRVDAVAVLSGAPAPYPDGKYAFRKMPPFLAIHGTTDEFIAYDGIVRAFNKARGPKVLVAVEGGGHGASVSLDGPGSTTVLATLSDFFAAYLRDDEAALDRLVDVDEPGVVSVVAATEPGSRRKVPLAPKVEYDRTLTVTPNTGLSGGDVVTVRWSGFSPGGVVNILQCGPNRGAGAARCELTTGALLRPDPTGEGELLLTIVEGAVGNGICDAEHPGCEIIANDDSSLDPDASVAVPITFTKRK